MPVAAEFTLRIGASAQDVHQVLREGMGHVELVSEDVFRGAADGTYIAILLYQHFFMRVKNQVALMLIVSGDSQSTTVKSVSCASSSDVVFRIDWGAAGDFAVEPIELLKQHYRGRVLDA